MSRVRWLSLCALALSAAPALSAPLDSRALDAVPLHVLPAADLDRVRATLPEPGSRGPIRLAVRVPMVLDLLDGTWTEEGSESVWRTRLYSAGATLLVAHFDRFDLPEGGALRISDTAGTITQGPYSAANRDVEGGLWTAMVPGEEALVELRVPTAQRDAADLRLASLGHGDYQLRNDGASPKSGSCNIDTVCPQGNNWRDQIRSAVRLQIPAGLNTVSLCSGQLVNNVAQNDVPYVLTATHCGVTTGNATGIVTYFNFETSSCGGTPNGSLTQNQTGAARVFAHERSDHTMIRLNAAPSSAFNVYLSGFNASAGTAPSSGVSIHHPGGDEKRISTYSTPAARQDNVCLGNTLLGTCNGTIIDTYRVNWSSGVTEQGSSGGGLWNQNRQLVGVLSGGATNCSNPGGDDFYGRLELAWSSGLSSWLDPNGTGTRSVGGKNPGGTPSTGGGSSGGGTTGGGTSSGSSGGGGGSFSAALALLLAGLVRLAAARRAGSRPIAD